jgi:hypothetical protein
MRRNEQQSVPDGARRKRPPWQATALLVTATGRGWRATRARLHCGAGDGHLAADGAAIWEFGDGASSLGLVALVEHVEPTRAAIARMRWDSVGAGAADHLADGLDPATSQPASAHLDNVERSALSATAPVRSTKGSEVRTPSLLWHEPGLARQGRVAAPAGRPQAARPEQPGARGDVRRLVRGRSTRLGRPYGSTTSEPSSSTTSSRTTRASGSPWSCCRDGRLRRPCAPKDHCPSSK